jgi:hypothetical protein
VNYITWRLFYKKFEPGETVYQIMEESEFAYFIIKGQMMVQVPDPSGENLKTPHIGVSPDLLPNHNERLAKLNIREEDIENNNI